MSKIEWTDETWNPIIGCSKISEGCKNCYAEKMAGRLANIKATHLDYAEVVKFGIRDDLYYGKGEWNGKTRLVESALDKPLKWKKPRKIFVCSMGDLFHESVNIGWIDKVMDIIRACPQHTFQILTKRPEKMQRYFAVSPGHQNYENVWLGVTAENQAQANKRIPILLQIPAKVHFVSIEPMLSAVDFNQVATAKFQSYIKTNNTHYELDWVICGGESGHNARPMHPDWVRSLRDQCESANVPFFFKQWGEWFTTWKMLTNNEPTFKMYESYQQFTQKLWVGKGDSCIDVDGNILKCGGDFMKASYPVAIMQKTGKKKAGSFLDGKEYKQFPISNF